MVVDSKSSVKCGPLVLNLGDLAPPWLVATFPEIPGVEVMATEDASLPRLEAPRHDPWTFVPESVPLAGTDLEVWALGLRDRLDVEARLAPIVLDSFISSSARRALDQVGVSYLDAHGHLSLNLPDILVRLHPASRPSRAVSEGLGVAGVRAVQVLLARSNELWAVTELAQRAGVSVGQAHRVFSILEVLDLIEAKGSGSRKRRRLRSPRRVLDWLVTTAPRSVRGRRRAFLYAPGPDQLLHRLGSKIETTGLPAVLTGAAGALALGAGPTSLPLAVVRVTPLVGLEHVAGVLGAELVDQGGNVELWPDTGQLGTHDRAWVEDVPVAPAVRVYLDCFHGQRGEDVAEHFREQVIGW